MNRSSLRALWHTIIVNDQNAYDRNVEDLV
jgi:hypothetical protein